MSVKKYKFILILLLIEFVFCDNTIEDTDCLPRVGSDGAQCHQLTTFKNNLDEFTNYIGSYSLEETHYLCCYYSGQTKNANGEIKEFNGCMFFKESEILDGQDSNLKDKMKSGQWIYANGVKIENPKIECSSKFIKKLFIFNFLLFLL